MDNYIGSMQHFTERFKSRLVEMALSDAESSIRVEAIQRLRQIDKHALLDDEQRDEIAGLIFDAEARIRRAAAVFFDNMLKESVDDKRGDYEGSRRQENEDQHSNEERENTLQWKCLAEMLVNLNTQLDAKIASQLQELAVPEVDDAGDDMEDTGTAESAFTRYNSNRDRTDAKLRKGKGPVSASQITAILQGQNKDRMSLAVETLHFEIEIIRNWQSLLDYLLLDHSAAQNGVTQNQASASTSAAPSVDAPATTSRQQVDATCRLTDAEESILLSVFVSSVKTTRDRAKLLASIVGTHNRKDAIFAILTSTFPNRRAKTKERRS